MPDPMQNINDAADALNQVALRASSFYDDADAEVALRQTAYDGLAGNLRGVVSQMMFYNAVWDPDVPEDPVENGSFHTLKGLLDAAPRGAMVSVTIPGGKTVDMVDDFTSAKNHYLRISTAAGGQRARIRFPTSLDGGGLNKVNRLSLLYSSGVELVDLELEIMAKTDAGAGWSVTNGAAIVADEQAGQVKMKDCILTGSEGAAFINASDAILNITLSSVDADGDVRIIGNAANGIFNLLPKNISLTSGAILRDGGTLGTNYLNV